MTQTATVLEGSTLYPIQSALGRALEVAEQDKNLHAKIRISKAINALGLADDVCRGHSLSENEERYARQVLMDIVDDRTDISHLDLLPLVLFVRSCARCEFTK